MTIELIEGDNLDVLAGYGDDSFDAVVGDPPYGVLGYEWDRWPGLETWRELKRVTKPTGFLAFTIAPHVAHERIPDVVEVGWRVIEVGVWVYGNGRPVSDGRLKRCYDLIYYFGQDAHRLNVEEARGAYQSGAIMGNTGRVTKVQGALGRQFNLAGKRTYEYGDDYYPANVACEVGCPGFSASGYELIFAVKRTLPIGRTEETHPTSKPLDLMAQMVKLVSRQGDIVCDPWMGGGTTGKVCMALGRRFVGIDINPEYVELARQDLATGIQMEF